MAKVKYSVRKYDGDDVYSYAVFRTADLKGLPRGVVFYGDARPLVSGCSKAQADSYKRDFEKENA